VYWRQLEVLPIGLASKLGFHTLMKAVLVAIYTGPQKGSHVGPWQLKLKFAMSSLDYAFYIMYWQQFEMHWLSLASN
jgi:hypothetical protein